MKDYAVNFLRNTIRTDALKFGEFQLRSGRISPYFFNLGDAMNDGEGVTSTGNAYVCLLMENGFGETFDSCNGNVFLFGPAYKGISLACVVAGELYKDHKLNPRWGYNRKEIKNHGSDAGEWLVGDLRDGDCVFILDDVITTSGVKRDSWEGLKKTQKGLKHCGISIALDRQEAGHDGRSAVSSLREDGIDVSSILYSREVFDYLHNRDFDGRVLVGDENYETFQKYQEEYGIKDKKDDFDGLFQG